MDCRIFRQKLLERLDFEIDAKTYLPYADAELEKHLAECASCRREHRIFSITRAVASVESPITAPAWFYQRLCRRIKDETQGRIGRRVVWKLACGTVPALTGITMMFAFIFVLQEARFSNMTLQSYNYEDVLITDDAARHLLADDLDDITYESVLSAIAERQADNSSGDE